MNKKIVALILLLIAILIILIIGISLIKSVDDQDKTIKESLVIQTPSMMRDNGTTLKGCFGGSCDSNYVLIEEEEEEVYSIGGKKKCDDCDNDDDDCDDDFYSDNYCFEDDVYRDFHDIFDEDDDCEEEIIVELVEECGEDYCEEWVESCVDDNVARERVCHEFLCADGGCNENTFVEEEVVEECGDDFYSDNYCIDNDVYRDFHDFGCVLGGVPGLWQTSSV